MSGLTRLRITKNKQKNKKNNFFNSEMSSIMFTKNQSDILILPGRRILQSNCSRILPDKKLAQDNRALQRLSF